MNKINIGCGNAPIIGFTNVDKYYYPGSPFSLTNNVIAATWNQQHSESPWISGDMISLSFPSESFDEVIMVHALEHVSMDDGNLAIKEAIRLCRKGGSVEIEVPNLEIACKLLLDLRPDMPFWDRVMGLLYGTSGMDGEGQFHLCGYTKDYLKLKMSQHDLVDIVEIPVGFGHGNGQEGHAEPQYDFRLRGTKK
jgi:SAM-dependent methyltransferase